MDIYRIISKFLISNNYEFDSKEIELCSKDSADIVIDCLLLSAYINKNYKKTFKEMDIINSYEELFINGYNINETNFKPITSFYFDGKYLYLNYSKILLQQFIKEVFNEK